MEEMKQEINDLNEKVEHLEGIIDELLDLLSSDDVMDSEVQGVLKSIHKRL